MIDPESIDIAQRRGRPHRCARQAIYFVGAEWPNYVECPISATVRRASVCRDIKVVRRRRTSFRMRNLRNICICRLVDGRQGYKILKDGTRRITAFMMPGDSCDLHATIWCAMDHGITAIRDCKPLRRQSGHRQDREKLRDFGVCFGGLCLLTRPF